MIDSGGLLRHVWGERQGYVFLPRKNTRGEWEEGTGWGWPSEEPYLADLLLDPDRYFCPLVFDAPHRRKEYALPTNVLWSDLDEARPGKCALKPSVAWRTTGGVFSDADVAQSMEQPPPKRKDLGASPSVGTTPHYQALWLLDEDVPAAEAAQLSKRIAYAEGADKGGWDVTQVLRLPGTLNTKHDPPHLVTMLWAKRLVYSVSQVVDAYPAVVAQGGSTGWTDAPTWPSVSEDAIACALAALPYGIRLQLQRDTGGADRSLELTRMAGTLLSFGVEPAVAAHILQRSSWNKYRSRHDEQARLLHHVAEARP